MPMDIKHSEKKLFDPDSHMTSAKEMALDRSRSPSFLKDGEHY
jgi:hypothetical protein